MTHKWFCEKEKIAESWWKHTMVLRLGCGAMCMPYATGQSNFYKQTQCQLILDVHSLHITVSKSQISRDIYLGRTTDYIFYLYYISNKSIHS